MYVIEGLEIFKVGEFIDAEGRQKRWTEEELRQIAELYREQIENGQTKAPLVIGHPITSSPAYGWVEKLYVEGGSLYADIVDVPDEIVELIKNKNYKYVSIMITDDGRLGHVGLLGAIPPAVSNIKELTDARYYKYSINKQIFQTKEGFFMNEKIETLINALMQFLRETFNEEVANQTIVKLRELLVQSGLITEEEIETQATEENETTATESVKKGDDWKSVNNALKEIQISQIVDEKIKEGVVLPSQKQKINNVLLKYASNYNAEEFKQFANEVLSLLPKQIEFNNRTEQKQINESDKIKRIINNIYERV